MQNIKVDVKVALASGASIGLTDAQYNQINHFIASMLFTEPAKKTEPKVKRAYVKKSKYRVWTSAEDELLLPLLTMESKSERTKYYKQVKRQLKRGSSSIYSRLYTLKKMFSDTKPNKQIPVSVFF